MNNIWNDPWFNLWFYLGIDLVLGEIPGTIVMITKYGYFIYMIYYIVKKIRSNKFTLWVKYLILPLLCILPSVYYYIGDVVFMLHENSDRLDRYIRAYLIITAGWIISVTLLRLFMKADKNKTE